MFGGGPRRGGTQPDWPRVWFDPGTSHELWLDPP